MNVIFLGDSITDAGRNTERGSAASIGQSYTMIVAAKLGAKYPNRFHFINTAVSGSKVVDLYARIQSDAWNQNPWCISILVGVNDVCHAPCGVDARRYEKVYRMLLQDTREHIPDVKFLLLEPFVLCTPEVQDNWKYLNEEVLLRAQIVKCLANEVSAYFVPLQSRFDNACKSASASYWLIDGIHPTPAGHQLIADAWLEAFAKI